MKLTPTSKIKKEILSFDFVHPKYGELTAVLECCDGDVYFSVDYWDINKAPERHSKELIEFEESLHRHISNNNYFDL
jgi:predicted DNA-binding protein (UPF0278 family)